MTATYSAVDCQEVHGTRVESHGFENQTASVDLRFAWADRYALASDLLQSGGRFYPYSTHLSCRTVGIRPEAGQYTADGQGMVYEYGIASVQYGALSPLGGSADPSDPTQLVAETIDQTTSFITLDHQRFLWADGTALKQDEAPGKLLRTIQITRQLFQVAFIPVSILSVAGTVNIAAYNSALTGLTFGIGTLLCGAPKMTRTISTDGVSAWTLTMTWEYQPNTWNKYYRYNTNDWQAIYTRDPSPPYGPLSSYSSYPPMDQRPFLPG